jgi:ribonuclease HI
MSAAIIHIDGASRGNPGPSSFAFVIAPPGQTPIEECGRLPDTTNNIAEYTALVKALEKAADLSLRDLRIHSDSELLVKQMNGEYRVKNPDLKNFYDDAQVLLRRFSTVRIDHVRREQNKRADQLCNVALDADKPKLTSKEKKSSGGAKASAESVREDCVLCLQAARNAWAAQDEKAPTPAQVWEQLWSILEESGVLKKPKAK